MTRRCVAPAARGHGRLLEGASWLEDHPLLWERLRGGGRWSAVDALDAEGSELFHACRPSYAVDAEVFQEGTLGARISRVLERSLAAAGMIAGFWKDVEQPLAQVRLAGRVLLGDGSDSAVAAERMETVRAEVERLDSSARERCERAMAELDRLLRDDALAWDEGVVRREVNEPLVEQLSRAGSA